MNPRILLLVVSWLFFLSLASRAQMTNDAFGSLTLNGVNGAPPNLVHSLPGVPLSISVSGNPDKPFVLLFGAGISVGSQVFAPGIQLDIGPSPSIVSIANGFGSPTTNFFDAFANTGPTGTSNLVLPIPVTTPPGTVGALQAFVVDFTVPGFVAATAASALVIDSLIPEVLLSAEATAGQTQVSLIQPPAAPVALPGLGNISYRDIGLQRFGEMFANEDTPLSNNGSIPDSAGGFFRNRPPTASEPRFFADRLPGPFVRTVHGDIFQVSASGLSQSGFMRVHGNSAEILSGTMKSSFSSSVSAWKPLINVQNGILAAVTNGNGIVGDRIFLIRIDGGVFAATGTAALDVTPTGANLPSVIYDRSLTIAGGVLYFCADVPSNLEKFFRVNLDGATPPAVVNLPSISASVPTARVDPEIRVRADQQVMYLKASSLSGSVTGLCRVDSITSTGQAATMISVPILPLKVADFGRAANGRDGRFSISPSGNRIAFVVQDSSAELYTCLSTGAAVVHINNSPRFDDFIDTVQDINVIDDDRVLFWAGTTIQQMDLYVYRVSTGILQNITMTNGFSGAILPIPSSPASSVNPEGQVRVGNRMLFLAERTPTTGPAAGLLTVNVFGLDLQTLVPYNITGDVFPGQATTNIRTSTSGHLMQISATSDIVWLQGTATVTSLSRDLISFDAAAGGLATFHLGFGSAQSGSRITTLRPKADGSSCLAIQTAVNASLGDRIIEGHLSAPYTIPVPDDGLAEFTSIERFPQAFGQPGFFFVKNGPIATPSTRVLRAVDATGLVSTVVPSLGTTGVVQILAIESP